MSGLWGPQSSLDLYLQEEGITTLFMSGVNADQCVLGTLIDSYYRGYDVVLVQDATATTSPEGGYANVCWNVGNVRYQCFSGLRAYVERVCRATVSLLIVSALWKACPRISQMKEIRFYHETPG